MDSLIYRNEDDKAYGLAGMMYTLGCVDALDTVAEVDIDSDGPMVTFSHEYYFTGSPSLYAKAAWDNLVRNFHITSLMALANVFSRSLVRDRVSPAHEILDPVLDAIRCEGIESCPLEEDEVKKLSDNAMQYVWRLFSNPRVHPMIQDLSRTISSRRHLSGRELLEVMEYLRIV